MPSQQVLIWPVEVGEGRGTPNTYFLFISSEGNSNVPPKNLK